MSKKKEKEIDELSRPNAKLFAQYVLETASLVVLINGENYNISLDHYTVDLDALYNDFLMDKWLTSCGDISIKN